MKLKVKETIADILAYLLQVERKKLLWTNSGTAIGAQTISLALSDFDEVEVEFCVTDAFSNDDHTFSRCRVGGKGLGQWWCVNQSAGSNYGAINYVSRSFSASTTGVTFQSGQMLYAGTSYFNWNNRCVPVRIYGIKSGGGVLRKSLIAVLSAISKIGGGVNESRSQGITVEGFNGIEWRKTNEASDIYGNNSECFSTWLVGKYNTKRLDTNSLFITLWIIGRSGYRCGRFYNDKHIGLLQLWRYCRNYICSVSKGITPERGCAV